MINWLWLNYKWIWLNVKRGTKWEEGNNIRTVNIFNSIWHCLKHSYAFNCLNFILYAILIFNTVIRKRVLYIKKEFEVILVSVLGQTRGHAHIYPTTIVCFRLPKDTGPGTVSETMYYLSLFSRQREPFQCGCYGNDNHFKTFIIILIVLKKAIHVGKMNTRRKGLKKSDPEKTHGISYRTCSWNTHYSNTASIQGFVYPYLKKNAHLSVKERQ